VDEYSKKPPTDMATAESPEYKLIVEANNIAVEIDNEILVVHKVLVSVGSLWLQSLILVVSWQFARDHYAPRFSELETLVASNPLDYTRTVKAMGNPKVSDVHLF
jgi:U4/U6 small nuclear ribonucleoprotein PRP31